MSMTSAACQEALVRTLLVQVLTDLLTCFVARSELARKLRGACLALVHVLQHLHEVDSWSSSHALHLCCASAADPPKAVQLPEIASAAANGMQSLHY